MRRLLCVLISFTASSCIFSSEDPGDVEPLGGSRTVEGTVVDFESGQPISGAASVSTSGLVPEPEVTTQGASFTIKGVPDNSAFQIKASSDTHQPTFSEAVIVELDDLSGVTAPVVSTAFINTLATGFGVSPTATRGVLIARVVDEAGQPKAGISRNTFALDASVTGPFFLGDNRQPLPNAMQTSNSGWVVWFEVNPGLATLGTTAGSTSTLEMPISPVSAGTVTIAQIRAINGAPVVPVNVSFARDVIPIFAARGCVACHSGGGIGKDLGGLTLDVGAPSVYRELTVEDPLRVQVQMPAQSQLLTYPSREIPADRHPNVTFTSPQDPDYVKILAWIREGARDN